MKLFKPYPLVCLLLVSWILFLYLPIATTFKDLCSETNMSITTVQYMLESKAVGKNVVDFFNTDPRFDNFKQEDPIRAFAPYNKHFMYEYYALVCPLTNLALVPFVKILGVIPETVTIFALFFCLLSLFITWRITHVYFGKWLALLSTWLLSTNLIWLLHTRVAYSNQLIGVCFLLLLVKFLFDYISTGKSLKFILACFFGGIVITTGWICMMFVPFLLLLGIILVTPNKKYEIILDIIYGFISGISAMVLVFGTFIIYFNCTLPPLLSTWFSAIFMRGGDSAIGGWHPTFWDKIVYAIKCFWIDGKQLDHLDKCLPGSPGIPVLFSVLFLLGLWSMIRCKSKQMIRNNWILWTWLLVGNIFVIFIFVYAHRYVLNYLPAIAIIASQGYLYLFNLFNRKNQYRLLLVTSLCIGIMSVCMWYNLYDQYNYHDSYDFEVDRYRGYNELSQYLKNENPNDTLIVLSDPNVACSLNFQFYTYYKPFTFVYWWYRLGTITTKEELLAWENQQFTRFNKIVYIFSNISYVRNGKISCDVNIFRQAHPNNPMIFCYNYNNRQGLLYTHKIEKSPN